MSIEDLLPESAKDTYDTNKFTDPVSEDDPALEDGPLRDSEMKEKPTGVQKLIREDYSRPDSDREHFKWLAENKPLTHPGVSSIAHHDYDHAPPEHLRNMYGKIYRGLSERYPDASKHILELHPREHGKSEAASVVVPSWAALRNPNIRIAIISMSSTLAKKKLAQCKEIIQRWSNKYNRRILENKSTRLTLQRSANHSEGTIEATGMGGSITGGHYDLIIFDDILSWDNQRTETQRNTTEQRFKDYMNLGSRGETAFVVIGTRKHPEDLYSGLIENPLWDANVTEAIQDWSVIENKEYTLVVENKNSGSAREIPGEELHTIDGRDERIIDVNINREDVEVLWPERWPIESLVKNMLSTQLSGEEGMLVWRRENQNDAQAMEGQVLSLDMINYVSKLRKTWEKYSWYAGLDPAIEDDPEKAAQNDTDYWGLGVIAYDREEDTSYLHRVSRRRGMTLAKAISWVKDELSEYNISRVLVESNQAQRWFVQSAKDKGLRVDKTSSADSKKERIINMASRFETGKVKIVASDDSSAMWQGFEEEWVQFPSGDHDDRLDGVEIALRNVGGTTVTQSKHELGEVF